MDWMTLTITLTCGFIFLCFIIIPIGEFREIFRAIRVRRTRTEAADGPASLTDGEGR